jgi:hypothetical protein
MVLHNHILKPINITAIANVVIDDIALP